MHKTDSYHIPVLLHEAVVNLRVNPGEKYLDGTVGGGGHAAEIMRRGGNLLGLDLDPEALAYSQKRLSLITSHNTTVGSFSLVHSNFSDMQTVAEAHNFLPLSGILLDLGVSSHQLEADNRGFSFNQDGLLDMRMDTSGNEVTARDLLNGLTEGELNELFTKLGEEKFARRFARAISGARRLKPIETCDELASLIVKSAPPRGRFDRIHPATRVFQALRIAVNDELNSLRQALPAAAALLKPGGRLVVISFHSLEDGIVKRFIADSAGLLTKVGDKPITPTAQELIKNPRARSAKMRVCEKHV